jgi:hypothetical protein
MRDWGLYFMKFDDLRCDGKSRARSVRLTIYGLFLTYTQTFSDHVLALIIKLQGLRSGILAYAGRCIKICVSVGLILYFLDVFIYCPVRQFLISPLRSRSVKEQLLINRLKKDEFIKRFSERYLESLDLVKLENNTPLDAIGISAVMKTIAGRLGAPLVLCEVFLFKDGEHGLRMRYYWRLDKYPVDVVVPQSTVDMLEKDLDWSTLEKAGLELGERFRPELDSEGKCPDNR